MTSDAHRRSRRKNNPPQTAPPKTLLSAIDLATLMQSTIVI